MTDPARRPLPEVFADAERPPEEVAALLHRARALRLELEAVRTPAPASGDDGERMIHGIIVTRLEASLEKALEDVVAVLAQVRGLQRGLEDDWLKGQLKDLTG